MTVKDNRQYVTQDELNQIKQLPIRTAIFSRGRFTGFYDENTTNFYVTDQYGRLTGMVAQVPKEKFDEDVPAPHEDTLDEYRKKKSAAVLASDETIASLSDETSAFRVDDITNTEAVQETEIEKCGKRSTTVFRKKKAWRSGLTVGLCVGGIILAAAGVCFAQYFGVLNIPFLDPVADAIRSVLG